jgi:hypothetical protein
VEACPGVAEAFPVGKSCREEEDPFPSSKEVTSSAEVAFQREVCHLVALGFRGLKGLDPGFVALKRIWEEGKLPIREKVK